MFCSVWKRNKVDILTVFIGIHIHCSHFESIEVCVVAAIIYNWVVTVLCSSKVDRNDKYTL